MIVTCRGGFVPHPIRPKKTYLDQLGLGTDQPLHILNLVRYKDKASYAEGSTFEESHWTGHDAETLTHCSGPIVIRTDG
ncbi:MAG: hypothetical protein ABJO27_17575 [Pseudoruegeria sp.]